MNFEIPEEIRHARRPFSFEGGKMRQVGVLCLHGFTGSPAEMRPLGNYLAEQGYTVVCPLLPRHGGWPHELKGAKWQDWVSAAQCAYDELTSRCECIFIAGLSMGGLITLHLAANAAHAAAHADRHNGKRRIHPAFSKLKGIIVMAAPIAISDKRAKLVRYAKHFVPYYYPLKDVDFSDPKAQHHFQKRLPKGMTVDFDDPRTVKAIKNSIRIPLGAIHELMVLNERVMKELPRVTQPAVFFQGRKDSVVAPNSADVLASRISSQNKRVVWYENSAHELPLEPDSMAMCAEIDQFIHANSVS